MGGESVAGRGADGPMVALVRPLNDAYGPTLLLPARVGKIFNGDSRRDKALSMPRLLNPRSGAVNDCLCEASGRPGFANSP